MTFQLTFEQAQFLQSTRGVEWLSKADDLALTPTSHLADLQMLRRILSPDEAAAVVEQVLLRRRGQLKFERAKEMLFLRDALEQATHYQVAQHRAQRFKDFASVADLGCGIGGDTLHLGQVVDSVWGFDLNLERLIFAQHNCNVYNLSRKIQFSQADILNLPSKFSRFEAFFVDPARRTHRGQRIFKPHHYLPPLNQLMHIYKHQPMGIKVAPGFNFSHAPLAGEIEVVSLAGEVKETVLWFNDLATPGVTRQASLLTSGKSINSNAPNHCPVDHLDTYLYEPDPAIIRAGLIKQVGAALNLHLVDKHIAYLSGPTAIQSPLVKGYKIEAELPLKAKQINRYLKKHHISHLNIKQRGTGLIPEALSKQLKPTKKGIERTLILVRFQDKHSALVCKRI